jgi:hypothetical protein
VPVSKGHSLPNYLPFRARPKAGLLQPSEQSCMVLGLRTVIRSTQGPVPLASALELASDATQEVP